MGKDPKKQRLITDFHKKEDKVLVDHQEKVDLSPPEEGERDKGAKEVKEAKEARDLKDIIMEENMARRGEKAMMRSLKKKRQAKDKFYKYTNQYKNLA